MTPPEDNQRDEPGGPRLDEEALWRAIVENYGERAQLDPDPGESEGNARTLPAPAPEPVAGPEARPDAVSSPPTEPMDREEHFVPPVPPPLPRATPARRVAWFGLFLAPVLMVVAVVLHWSLPTWASTLLVAGFVGGFVFLVATMPRDGGDGWNDGAVV
jgi:hypothetical protein